MMASLRAAAFRHLSKSFVLKLYEINLTARFPDARHSPTLLFGGGNPESEFCCLGDFRFFNSTTPKRGLNPHWLRPCGPDKN
jgi:hypothetical protein